MIQKPISVGCELFTAVEDIHQPFDISGTNSGLEGQQSGSVTLINFWVCIFWSITRKKRYEMPRISLLIAEKFWIQGCKTNIVPRIALSRILSSLSAYFSLDEFIDLGSNVTAAWCVDKEKLYFLLLHRRIEKKIMCIIGKVTFSHPAY